MLKGRTAVRGGNIPDPAFLPAPTGIQDDRSQARRLRKRKLHPVEWLGNWCKRPETVLCVMTCAFVTMFQTVASLRGLVRRLSSTVTRYYPGSQTLEP